jgi:hypothetical protein
MKIKSLFFYVDFYPELRSLTPAQRGNLFLALIRCSQDDESAAAELDQVCALLFRMIVKSINRISEYRSINGAKGGKGNTRNKFVPRKNSSAADTDTDTESYNPDEFLTGDSPDNSAKSTENNFTIPLTAVQREQLSSELGEEILSQTIVKVELWATRKIARGEKINILDWLKTIRDAVGWSNSPSAMTATGRKNYPQRASLRKIPSKDAYTVKL